MLKFARPTRLVSRGRTLVSVVAAVAVAGLLSIGLVQPAFATTTGSFNLTLQTFYDHTVEADPGAPVQDAELDFYHLNDGSGQWVKIDQEQTNSSGQLNGPVTGLIVGDEYAVYVNATHAIDANNADPITDSNGWVVQQGELMSADFDGNAADGPFAETFFTATAGLFNPIADLNPGITLTGNILDPDGNPTTNANEIDFWRQNTDPNGVVSYVFYGAVYPNEGTDSSYSVTDLAPGNYDVEAHQAGTTAWPKTTFNLGQASFDASTPVDVDYSSDPITQDVQFEPAGSISGNVSLDPAFDPGDGVVAEVFAYPLDAALQVDGTTNDAYEADVDPTTGDYTVDVPAGTYDLQFVPVGAAAPETPTYYSQWYDNVASSQLSTPVSVSAPDDAETVDDQTIGQGLTVSGTVTATGTGDLDGIDVFATPVGGDSGFGVTTDSSGHYSLTLPPASYTLQFVDSNGFYPARYYNGSTDGSSVIGGATIVSQAEGSLTADFEYDAYSTLTVHVGNKAGTSLSNVNVIAEPVSDGTYAPNSEALESNPVSGQPGFYAITGLQQSQSYALYFDTSSTTLSGTYSQYYGGGEDLGTSKLVTPTDPTETLDVTLASAASVSGVVTNSSHAKLKGIYADLYNYDGTSWNWVEESTTSSTGAYSFGDLATGSYTVQFFTPTGSPYISTFAGGGADAVHATAVYVAPGKPAVLNATLATGGSITGTVGAIGGTPTLPDIDVTPVALTGSPGNFTAAAPAEANLGFTTSSGKFSLTGLPTGYYALSFLDEDSTYGDSYVSPVGDPSSTTPIYHVTAGHATAIPGVLGLPLLSDQATAQVNGSLDLSMAGLFDEAAGVVTIDDPSGNFVASAPINSAGNFSINLIPGLYSYSAFIHDPDNPQNVFASDNDTFEVSDGPNALVLPVVPEAPLAFTTDPAITDTSDSDVGTTYTLNDVTWNHTGTTVTYQWLRDGVPIYGATGTSYTSQGADVNADLQARVTVYDYVGDRYGSRDIAETIVGYATAANPVTNSSALFNTESPMTTVESLAEATVGEVIHAQPGDWDGIRGLTFSYQWRDDDTDAVVSTGPTFTPTIANVDHSYRLWVNASAPGYATPADYTPDASSFLVLELAAPVLKVAPKLTSKLVDGNTVYTVTPGTWSIAHTTPGYEWLENGTFVGDLTNTFTYDPTTDGATTGVTVEVAAQLAGHASGQRLLVAKKDTSPLSTSTPPGVLDSLTSATVPSASSPVTFGSVLTAETNTLGYYATDSTTPTSFSYQWQREIGATWVNIAGATHQVYTVGLADMGHNLQVIISGSSFTHTPEPYVAFAGQGAVRTDLVDVPAVITAASTNTGDPLSKVTETVGPWGDMAAVINHYQWYDCPSTDDCTDPADLTNFTAIAHATTNSYTPTLAQAQDTIVLVVTGTKSGYETGTVESNPVVVGLDTTIDVLLNPVVTAGLSPVDAVYGTKLTAKSGTFDVPGVTISYDWQVSVDGSTWTNANGIRTGLTYTPTLADMTGGNLHIRLAETATKAGGYFPATSDTPAYPLVGAIPVPKVTPVVATFNNLWYANGGTWPTATGTIVISDATYQWYIDGVPVAPDAGGTANNFDPTTVNPFDSVSVTVTDPGDAAYQPASRTVVAQKGTAPTWNAPTISGTAAYGNTLGAPTVISDAYEYPSGAVPDAVLTYQWYEGSVAIVHATSANYAPPTTYIGRSISVRVTSTSPLYATAVQRTAGVLFTYGTALHGSPVVSFSGSVHSGGLLGVTLGTYAAGVTHGYLWQVSTDDSTWTNISGATKPTYVVPPSYLGDYIRAVVATAKTGYLTTSDDTPGVLVFAPADLAPIIAPTLSGTGAVGTVLTVTPSTWNVTGTTVTYQWFRDGTLIPGVTGTTYTPSGDELGELISVDVTAHAAGYNAAVASPNVISVIAGAAPLLVTLPKITGVAAIGVPLTVSQGVWSLDDLTVTYQWWSMTDSGPAQISGATQSTFTPDLGELGLQVYVTVTVSRDGYGSNNASSALTAAVVATS